MENILEAISKLEKEKSSLLERMEQAQFRGRIANNRTVEVLNQIKAVGNFKAEKESDSLLVKLRVDTRQNQFDDIKTKISQCRAAIQNTQDGINVQSERRFDMIRELEEATITISDKMSRSCSFSVDSPTPTTTSKDIIRDLDRRIKVWFCRCYHPFRFTTCRWRMI